LEQRQYRENGMNRFLEAVKNMFRIEDLRNRVLFTLALLAVYRIGAHIPTPGINTTVLEQLFNQSAGSVLGIFDLFSGGNFRRLTIFALGIMPYITSSIILQLMTVVFPYLERLQKEGELGRRKITQYTRYLTIVLSVIQGASIAGTLQSQSINSQALVYHPGLGFTVMTILTLTTGSAFIMWLGEQISERGIGNGMSLIIFVGIVVGLPRAVADLYEKASTKAWGAFTPIAILFLIALMIAVVAFIVFVEGGQRRIPVQYAKRVVGRRVMGGQSSYLPLRVNSGGVIPPIFASSLLAFPATIALILNHRYAFVDSIKTNLQWGEPLYTFLYVTLILLFAFFYVGIVFNPTELADNMRKNGGFIPGIRPGRTTSEYVSKILKRLTFIGAIYLAIVCLLPEWMIAGIHLDHLGWGIGSWFDRHFPVWFLKGLGVQFYFGGTSLLIVVGVAMDTVQQLEAQLVMRNYEGFARKGRLRGRR
jgi:preprotein translocase subunit SecY